MDRLLDTLRNEVLDLRDQSESLTRQMWLLYVTFEDVICINHPHRQKALLATSVDIDHYLPRPRRHYERIEDGEEIAGAEEENRKRVIRCDHQTLNYSAGCSLYNIHRSVSITDYTSGTDREKQTSGRFCLDKQQIESVEVVSLDARAVSVSYKADFECNDQSQCLSGCKVGGHRPICDGHVYRTKGVIRRGQSVWGDPNDRTGDTKRAVFTHDLKTNDITSDRSINGPLGNKHPGLEVDKRTGVIPHLGLMRSASRMKAGQFVPGSPLVNRAKRHSLSEHASLTRDSARGFDSTTKELSRHTFPNGSGEMGVRSAAFHTNAWYPGSDYCLAKAVPGRGVTEISPSLCSPVSRPEYSRRLSDRGPVQKPGDYLSHTAQTRPVNQSKMLSVITQSACSRQMYTRQDKVNIADRADRRQRMSETTSFRKQSPLADDTQLSPVTISSGYESDSIPSPVQSELDKCGVNANTDDDHTDYFSQSDTYPKSQTRDIQTSEDSFGLLPLKVRSKQTPFIPTLTKSRFVRFGQRHNATLSSCQPGQSPTNCHKQSHKLAKVTRSMYAIIHDLQDESAWRKMRRHSCDAVQEKHGCGCKSVRRGDVSLSPIVSPELRSSTDVLTPQSETEENFHFSSPEILADDTPARHVPQVGGSSVSPTDIYSQIRKKQCAMSSVTQRLFHMDIKHQSGFEDDIAKPADRADDNSQREQVRRESLKQGYKYSKASEAQSDNEHIYEVIPGDESMISTLGMGSCENPKLAKWSTVVNLDTPTDLPPALPQRKYQGQKMDPPIPPRCSLRLSKESASICGQSVQLECDPDNQDYAVVHKVKPSLDNMSIDGCLDRLEEGEVGSDLDSELYSRVCPPQPRQRNTFDFSDLTSETYCRLDPVKQVVGIDEWSPGDMLNFIDGIHEQHTPKTRDNIYCLLQNSKTRAKFSESLEIETRLLHKGLLCTSWDSDDVTEPMTSDRLNCDFRQEIQPTYV